MDARSRAGLALALLAAVLVALAPPAGAAAKRKSPHRLKAFASCGSIVKYARRNTRRLDGGRGIPSRTQPLTGDVLPSPIFTGMRGKPTPAAAPQAAAPEGDAAAGAGGGEFSGTNVQEAGVDEPDVVKTDGRRIVVASAGVLRVLTVEGGEPRLDGSLPLAGDGHQLLLRGNRVLVMAGRYTSAGRASSTLTEVDISDPAAPVLRRTLDLPGYVVDARQTAGTARVVVTSPPRPVELPELPDAGVRTWVPRTVLHSNVTRRTFRRPVVPCDDVRHPPAFSGLDLTTVLTVDLDKGLYSVDRDAVMAGAETVYASRDSLYVASRRYVFGSDDGGFAPGRAHTELHRFDITDPEATTYRSSGRVEGYVLNQYALSEHAGALRVATTEDADVVQPVFVGGGGGTGEAPPPRPAPATAAQQRAESESFVTVLQERGSRLERVGRVGGLGRGERIYAVRFAGDKGFVVTFRQVDPLYTLDLSDKTAPKVLGELKILGYSAYLHPISDRLLLGVGQDAGEEGRRQGAQLSLFDVSDLRAPRRVAQASLGTDSQSGAETDPHAFLYWKPAGLTVVPLTRYGYDGSDPFTGVVGFRVGTDTLTEAGRFEHPGSEEQRAPIGRSLVIRDRLYTVSLAGVGANRLDTLAPAGFASFTNR
ncbi:MAG TPA: beta-propeller domain-containing protein [Solirubrobacteraceae bacterium]|jgi:uncharacterized secreted protein with C-terminal beta-propeller domain